MWESGLYLSDGETDEFPARAYVLFPAGYDGEHQGYGQEALDLYPPPSQPFDEVDCEEISWYVTGYGDDQVADCIPLQNVILIRTLGKANLHEDHRLIQVDSVKRHVEQEPA